MNLNKTKRNTLFFVSFVSINLRYSVICVEWHTKEISESDVAKLEATRKSMKSVSLQTLTKLFPKETLNNHQTH